MSILLDLKYRVPKYRLMQFDHFHLRKLLESCDTRRWYVLDGVGGVGFWELLFLVLRICGSLPVSDTQLGHESGRPYRYRRPRRRYYM